MRDEVDIDNLSPRERACGLLQNRREGRNEPAPSATARSTGAPYRGTRRGALNVATRRRTLVIVAAAFFISFSRRLEIHVDSDHFWS
jgi:hypothetical protein